MAKRSNSECSEKAAKKEGKPQFEKEEILQDSQQQLGTHSKDDLTTADFAEFSTQYNGVNVKVAGKGVQIPTSPIQRFADSKFNEKLKDYCQRFETTTPIQAFSCALIGKKRDVIGIAQTGSGKTAAFSLPIFNRMMKSDKGDRLKLLVLCPTRELCVQTHTVFEELQPYTGLRSVCVYGGMSRNDQLKEIRRHPQIVVATPGRLNDFLDSNEIDLSHISYVVLDEADRMLDMGFEPEVRRIISHVPVKRQTLMFSATWPFQVQKLALEFMSDPVSITIGSAELSANSQVSQSVEVLSDSKRKNSRLLEILSKAKKPDQKIIVFVLYKAEATRVEQLLLQNQYNVVSIHGDKAQNARNEAFERFRSNKSNILVATDVAARGLDIPNVELVINYTFPLTIEDYIHRIGRTGRGTKSGVSKTFFTAEDKAHSGELVNVLKKANQQVPEELIKFGTTIKKKEHKDYGVFYKEINPNDKGKHVKFDD